VFPAALGLTPGLQWLWLGFLVARFLGLGGLVVSVVGLLFWKQNSISCFDAVYLLDSGCARVMSLKSIGRAGSGIQGSHFADSLWFPNTVLRRWVTLLVEEHFNLFHQCA